MTLSPFDTPDATFDPGSMPSTSLSIAKAVWYRRPWFLATVGIIVVVAISVVMDLPHHVTKSEDVSQQNAVITQINNDMATCTFAVHESETFYRQALANTLGAANLPTVKNYVLQDQTACSFASGPVFDMTNNIQVVDTAAGKWVDAAYQATEKWVTYDAVGLTYNILQYFKNGPSPTISANLVKFQTLMAQDRLTIVNDLARASTILGTSLHPINVPVLTALPAH